MSVRTRYSIIKGVSESIARNAIANATKQFPGGAPSHSKWSDWSYVVRPKTFDAFVSADSLVITDDAWAIAKEIARIVEAPHLELRVQESDHWDFSLYRHGNLIADFSTRVAYFDGDPTSPRPWKKGSIQTFADAWEIPLENVRPYLLDWDTMASTIFGREGDKYPKDDWRQIFDFMSALGIDQPANNPDSFRFAVPLWESAHVRQPIWRRAIRKFSLWIKGTYPDVQKRTKEETEEWQRRRASVQVVELDLSGVVDRDRIT